VNRNSWDQKQENNDCFYQPHKTRPHIVISLCINTERRLINIRHIALARQINKSRHHKKNKPDYKAFIKNISDNNKTFFSFHNISSFQADRVGQKLKNSCPIYNQIKITIFNYLFG